MLTRKTDAKGRLTLGPDFATCTMTVEFHGEEVRLRKIQMPCPRKYSFKQLMAGVTAENIHGEIETGNPAGREAL